MHPLLLLCSFLKVQQALQFSYQPLPKRVCIQAWATNPQAVKLWLAGCAVRHSRPVNSGFLALFTRLVQIDFS